MLLAKLWAVCPRATGTANIAGWYPWKFDFRKAHFAAAWMTIGGLLVHVAAVAGIRPRRCVSRWRRATPPTGGYRAGASPAWWAASGLVTVATAGATIGPLRALSVLATRDPGSGPQGLPVNRSAIDAGTPEVDLSAFRLRVQGKVAEPLS